MAQGRVTVNNLNMFQGEFPEIERTFLFIGEVPGDLSASDPKMGRGRKLVPVNTQTNFDIEFGEHPSVLKTNLEAALINAGQNWQAFAIPMRDNDDHDAYLEAIDEAMPKFSTISPEAIVILRPVVASKEIEDYHAKLMEIRARWGRFIFAILAADGIDKENETWTDYYTAMEDMVDSVSANMVSVIPQLHGNDVGMVSGRLCNRMVSIADSPMRVATGPVLSLGETPVDKDGRELPDAILFALDNVRLSCIQRYPDYPGTFFGDLNMLEEPIGDYKVVEYVRVILKAMRAVRLLAIARIANRILNSTFASMEAHKQYFARPMRQMSKSVTFFGYVFPGECYPPTKNSVEIVWKSKTKVEIYLLVRPYNSPKDITANLILDLTTED